MSVITSRKKPVVAHVRKLINSRAYRRECGEFVCDGRKLFDEAVRNGAKIHTVLKLEGVKID